jgi:hemoglobin
MTNSGSSAAKNISDIQSGEGVRKLVDSFYGNARKDKLLGPVFEEAIDDWQHHLPTMYQFWERMLFGIDEYAGNPLEKHFKLPIEAAHFTRWIKIFNFTVDGNFSGAKAERAKMLAKNIAGTFQMRMGITPENLNFSSGKYSQY